MMLSELHQLNDGFVNNNVYLRGVAITDEEFDRILLEPVGDFGNWNYIIRGFKKGN